MASNYPSPPASPRRLDDLLICPVCLEGFRDPRTLSCLHTFCTDCLEQCRRAYRRDITCPVCKKVTQLPALGVQGLQNDFRVQQIKDILINQGPDYDVTSGGSINNKICDLCKAQDVTSPACHHCIQCYMYFCGPCLNKHNNNTLFSSHHVINMGESNVIEVLFCRLHKDHPVRYFCKPCSLMMCTICTMSHNNSHIPEPLEKGIIKKYRVELEHSLKAIKSKLSDVKSKTKYLEIIKETHQKALYNAQSEIKKHTEKIIENIRKQEQHLLKEVQCKIDSQLKENGIDTLGEIKFYKNNMESLYTEIESVIQGSPQQCLMAYEDLISRMKAIPETPLGSPNVAKQNNIVKFIPSQSKLELLIGTLEECNLEDEEKQSLDPNFKKKKVTHEHSDTPKGRKRTTSILSALSLGKKNEVKIGKLKTASSSQETTTRSKINADEIMRKTDDKKDISISNSSSPILVLNPHLSQTLEISKNSQTPVALSQVMSSASSIKNNSTAILSPPTALSLNANAIPNNSNTLTESDNCLSALSINFRLVFKVDQVGQWPGKITVPSGIAFLPDGNLVVAESENRLQVFDRSGHSIRIIGWGKVEPQRVASLLDGRIAVTDKKDRCIKVYAQDGDLIKSWGAGMFEMPTGIAINSAGNYIISDADRHLISIHRSDGTIVTQFGSWGDGDYQFNSPTYVTVDKKDNIYVSDTCNSCIKVYDEKSVFIRKFNMLSSKQGQTRRPQGLTVANNGNIIVVDRENHRITMYSPEGKFIQHLLCKLDGLKYPCDVKLAEDNHIAVVESHSGFLTKDPHHCIKLFHLL